MISKKNGIEYIGDYQFEDVIRQELKGPIGQGVVKYPNGDRFEGFFHLSYAHINGPAYAADGKYQFADGSVIEHAWINTSDDLEVMDLIGVYRVKHPQGPDTLTPFYRHKRSGIEVVLAEKPYAVEWNEGKKLQELEMDSYEYKQIDEDRSILTVKLKDGTLIKHYSGDTELNNYDERVFKTRFESEVHYPNGSFVDCYGYGMRDLKPYDGYITIHSTNGKYHHENWKEGRLEKAEEERWDFRMAKTVELPDPFDKNKKIEARVWDGHISYRYPTWTYDGEMKDGMPNGIGVLVSHHHGLDGFGSNDIDTEGRRYEGEFKDGLCHGYGVFTYPRGGIVQDGEWVEGVFQEKEAPDQPIMLKVVLSGDDSDNQMVEAKVGSFPYFSGFGGLRIDRIEKGRITFSDYGKIYLLTPGETLYLHHEIEGDADHDGCVYDSKDYYLRIIWRKRYS